MTTTSTNPRILRDEALHAAITEFCRPRAADTDACRASLREGIAHLARIGATSSGVQGHDSAESFERLCEVVATVAMDDMSQAFSLWAHRMAVEYLEQSDLACPLRADTLSRLVAGEILGSTSFASATANYLAGTPLPLTYREAGGGAGIVVNGRIPWASNLEAPFLSVAAAAHEDDPERRIVFAYTDQTPGVSLPPYPQVLALQSTNSTSPIFQAAEVPAEHILTANFTDFVGRVLATFLLIQSSFCWGLARRSLSAAEQQLHGQRAILADDLAHLMARAVAAEGTLRELALTPDRSSVPPRPLLELRLEWGRIAVEAVALELMVTGGQG
ncbi:MAG: acyl-CoA dehydrogenase family protein, partial [Dehalococcoidia bacterium]